MKVNATDMKNYFGKYLEKCKDEAIFITKNDRVVAKLIACEDPSDGFLMLRDGSAAYTYSCKRITYEDFLKISESSPERYEYIDGEIYMMSSPDIFHQLIHARIFNHLANWLKGKKCHVFSAPMDVTLVNDELKGKNVVQPDILVSCDYLEQKDEKDRYTGIPALVIEIISAQTRTIDYVKKLNVYFSGGVGEYWVVDPKNQIVTLYSFIEKQLDKTDQFKHPEVVKSIRFEGLEIPTAIIFGD